MNPNVTQCLSSMASYNLHIKLGAAPLFDTEEAAPPAFRAA